MNEQIRPAWREGTNFQCSYCGRRLGVSTFAASTGKALFETGWVPFGGRIEWRKPHHKRSSDLTLGGSRDRLMRSYQYELPVTVVCRNRACGELVEIRLATNDS